jgi:hypothetical protein
VNIVQIHFPKSFICGHGNTEAGPWGIVLLENLIVAQLVKIFSSLYGIGRFISILKKNPPLLKILCQMNPVQTLTPYSFKNHFL